MPIVATEMLSRAPASVRRVLCLLILGLSAIGVAAQPANDDFANAEVITGISGSAIGSNVDATTESGEPANAGVVVCPFASVWYKWTAPKDGSIIFDTVGSTLSDSSVMDTVLGVYTGTSVDALTPIAGNDDYNPNVYGPSRVAFNITAGTDYYISVDGYGEEGNTVLNWREGGSLSAGELQFTSVNYLTSENESFGGVDSSASPTIRNSRVTVTRLLGSTGRISVGYTVTNLLYTNYFYTNFFGTNITVTNIATNGITVSNIVFTNFFVTNQFENNVYGNYTYCNEYYAQQVSGTNGFLVISNIDPLPFITNSFFCTNYSTTTVTNDATSTNITVVTYFCDVIAASEVVNSAEPNVDYTPDSNVLTLDDYQMSANIDVTVFPNVFNTHNKTVVVMLSDPSLDALESQDIAPPTLNPSLSTCFVDVLSQNAAPGFFNGCDETNMIVNFARANYRVSESNPGYIIVDVLRSGGNANTSISVDYRIDNLLLRTGSDLRNNVFDLTAGSDYAAPFVGDNPDRYAANQDFTPVQGTLTWAANDFSPRSIQIPILKDNLVEFNEDFILQLYNPQPVPVTANTGPRTILGYQNTAIVTILFDDQPAGAMDRGWNPDGSLSTDPPRNQRPGANKSVFAVAVQPSDGKTVIGGDFTSYNTKPRTRLARINTDGSFDYSFDPGSGANDVVDTIAIDPSGKIIIGGAFTSINGTNRFGIARLNSNGSLDASFNPGLGVNGSVWSSVIQPDGKILIGGDFTFVNGTNRNYIARLNPDGSLDTTFDPGFGCDDIVFSVVCDSVGRILIGGQFSQVGGTNRNSIARLNTDGSLDSTFDPGLGADDKIYSVVAQPDNRVLIAGAFRTVNVTSRASIARLNTDGTVDASFDPGSGADDVIYSMLLQADGKILIAGRFTSFNETRRVGIARLFDYGSVDTSFMDTAYNQFAGLINHYYDETAVNTNLFPSINSRNIVFAMAQQTDGKVLIGGSFSQVGGGGTRSDIHPRLNVCRLIGNATPGPGNVQFANNQYYGNENGVSSYITLIRTNGSLGIAQSTVEPVTLPPGPGAAVNGTDFTFDAASYGTPTWVSSWARTRMLSDGIFGQNTTCDTVDPSLLIISPYDDVSISIKDNYVVDGNRNFNLKMSKPNGTDIFLLGGENIPLGVALGRSSAGFTIVDDDIPTNYLNFSMSLYTVNEGDTNATLEVRASRPSQAGITVKYRVDPNNPGTAVYGQDYTTNKNNTITIGPNLTNATFKIGLINDNVLEPDKTINFILYSPSVGAFLGTTSAATLLIVDDDFGPGHVRFASTNFDTVESLGHATVTVARSGGNSGLISVQYATSDGSAVNGLDYVGVTNTLSWNDKDTTPRTITIPIIDDDLVESNETFNVRLFNPVIGVTTNDPQNALILTNQITNATVTIINDDGYGVPSFVVTNYFVMENAGSAVITIARVGGGAGSVSVGYATMDGTATNRVHYSGVTNRLDFAPGETSKSFSIPIIDNLVANSNRTVNLVLFNPSPSVLSSNYPLFATLTIIDDESNNEPAGSLDPSYNPSAGANDFIHALALQPDGKLLVAGDFTTINKDYRNRVARLNGDGSLDNGFLNGLSGVDGTIRALVSQTPDGTNLNGAVLIGGNFTSVNGVNRRGIARLNLNGSLDIGFDPGAGADNPIYAIAETFLGPTRKVLVAGNFTTLAGVQRNGIGRLNDNGSVDATFDPGTGIDGTNGTIFAIGVQANGKIVIGGDFTTFNGTPRNHLARLNPDGSLDAAFSVDTGAIGSVRAIKIQPDGKILIGGLFTTVNGTALNHVARLNSNGSVDSTFNGGLGANDSVLAITLDAGGKILLGGEFTRASGVTRNRLTRLNADGTVDPTINFGLGANNFVSAIVVQPADGRIIVGGGFTEYDGQPRQHLAKIFGGSMTGAGNLSFASAYYGVVENGTNAVITVRRRGGTGDAGLGTVYVTFSTSDGTAIAGTDYLGVTNVLAFPVGETFESISVPIIDNFIIDGDRTVNLALSNPTDAALGGQPIALLTITNDDCAISFKSTAYRVAENVAGSNALITVVRSGSSVGTSSIEYLTVANGTATENLDYTPVTNILTFAPGETTKTFSITIINDTAIEGDETVGLQLRNPINAILSTPNSAALTIVDDDFGPGVLAFSAEGYFVNEGSNAVVTLIRTNGSSGPVSVRLTTSDVTATDGLDYRGTNGFITFADGEISKDVIIPTYQDTIVEGNELLNLTLSNAQGGATIGGTNVVPLTIIDDDVSFSFSAPAYFVNEGDGSIVITVRRDNGTNGTVQVNYATTNAAPTNGIAVAGVDYTNTAGTLTFAPGETLKTFNVPITEDTLVEGNEMFSVVLSNPIGAQLGNPSISTVTIIDNDTGFKFSNTNYVVDEAGTNIIISVDRVNPNTGIATVNFATADGTARAGADYLATNGTFTFLDGESTKTFVIPILDDALVEGDETVLLALLNPSTNATLLASNAVLTIVDNDPGVRFSSGSYSISETNVTALITVLRTTVTNRAVSVDFVTSNLTATAGLDYQATGGTLSFAPGETVKTFPVTIIDDTIIEGDEDVLLYLSNPTGGAVLENPSVATLTIVDNDGSYIVPAGSALLSESGAGAPDGVIDPNENVTMLFAFRNKSGGNTTNLVATLLATNGVASPSPSSASYGVLVTNGPSVSRQFSFTANGTNGQRITATFLLQDGTKDLGIGQFSFVLGKSTLSFTNAATIVINDSTNPPTKASPYPSTISIAGYSGTVSKLTASFYNVSHPFPDDIDALLVGPNGQKALLMSDCGGTNPLSHVNLTFDDSASSSLPDNALISSGTYKPTNFETNDIIPSPAPPGPYGTALSTFSGQNPNGVWSLYIVDDTTLDSGGISNGWSLTFTTSSPVPAAADLVATMTASPSPAVASNVLTYTITLTNYGPSKATAVTSTYSLPPGVAYVTNIDLHSGQVCDPNPLIASNANGVTITLAHGDFPKDAGVALTLVVVPSNIGLLTNTLTVAANEADPNPNNNVVSVVTSVGVISADLAVSLIDFPDPVLAGDFITYVISVTNNGPSTASGVVLSNTLPPGVNFISASASPFGTCSNASGIVVCTLGNMAAGPGSTSADTVTIVVQTSSAGEKINTARVSSSAFDPLKGNNSASVKTDVQAPPVTFIRNGSSLVLSWPGAASRYKLETATSLTPPVSWMAATNPAPSLNGGVYTFSVTATNSQLFFRLRASIP